MPYSELFRKTKMKVVWSSLILAGLACGQVYGSGSNDIQNPLITPTPVSDTEVFMDPTEASIEREIMAGTLSADQATQDRLVAELPEGIGNSLFKLLMIKGGSSEVILCSGILAGIESVQITNAENNLINWIIGQFATAEHCLADSYGNQIVQGDWLTLRNLNEQQNGSASLTVIPLFHENMNLIKSPISDISRLVFAVKADNYQNREWQAVSGIEIGQGTDLTGQRVIISGAPLGANGNLILYEGNVTGYNWEGQLVIDAPGHNQGSSGGPVMIPGSGVIAGMDVLTDLYNPLIMYATNIPREDIFGKDSKWIEEAKSILQDIDNQ